MTTASSSIAAMGLEIGGGVGLVVGRFAPPLLAATVVGGAVGGVIGKFMRHKVESGLEEKMGAALPPGTAGVVAIYDCAKTDTVNTALASAVRKSVAEVDGGGAKELKSALSPKRKPAWAAKRDHRGTRHRRRAAAAWPSLVIDT